MRPGRARDERGFALVVVLLVLALVSVVAAEFSFSMRLEAAAVQAYKSGITAGHLAETAVAQAIREIVGDSAWVGLDERGLLTFYTQAGVPLPHLPREQVEFTGGRYSYRISDEEGRINLNTAPPERVDRLLLTLGVDKGARDTIVDSLQDWRDANEAYRLNGAESEDTYLRLAVPYRSRNADLESVTELLQVKGVTRALFQGAADRPALVDQVTVKTEGRVNINTAGPVVLQALGLSDAEISQIVGTRRGAPFSTVPGQFAGRGLAASTRTFRIDAEGIVDGRVGARLTAIVVKVAGAPPAVRVVEWSGFR